MGRFFGRSSHVGRIGRARRAGYNSPFGHDPRRGRRTRRCAFEPLEHRTLLDGSGLSVGDDSYAVLPDTTLHGGLVNGTFEAGGMTGWAPYTTPGGTLGGAGFPDIVSFDTNGDGVKTNSLQLMVGDGGGGAYQDVALAAGEVTITVDVATTCPVANPEGGLFELLLDGEVVASHDFKAITANNAQRTTLSATLTDVTAGDHEIRIKVTRGDPSQYGGSPLAHIDNVRVFGNAAGVLANDFRLDGETVETRLVTWPEHGTLELNPDGTFRYEPEAGFTGTDSFVYKAVGPGEGLTLYTVDRVNDKLLKLDATTAAASVVGAIGHDMHTVDLTYLDGLLYALNVGGGKFELVGIDPATGAKVSVVPVTISKLTVAKGLTALGDSLYVVYSVKSSYCGNACGAAQYLGRLNRETGAISGLVNYRSLDGGFNHDFHALATDAEGRIIASREYWDTIKKWYLGFDPPSFSNIGGGYPPDASVNDTTTAGRSYYVLNTGGKLLHRYDPRDSGYSHVVENVPLGPVGSLLGGVAYAPDLEVQAATVTIHVSSIVGTVEARHLFYNASSFDGENPAANADDDLAIASDKTALLPGETADFANYSTYGRGINGVMVDLAGLPEGTTPEASDFQFRVGNDDEPGNWLPAPEPAAVTLRTGAGVGGSDRVSIVWPDNAIRNTWLEVTALADGLGLIEDDVFYFGNAVADSGNSATDAQTNVTDLLLARNNTRTFLNPAAIDDPYDYDRDQRCNVTDVLLARNNVTNFLTALSLLDLSGDDDG